MKLADAYNPRYHKIENNQIYIRYEEQLDKAIMSPGDFDATRETITQDAYVYQFTPEESEFYRDLYVTNGTYPNADKDDWLRGLFGDALGTRVRVGINERDLLAFPFASTRVLLLTAPIGWGKTSLLKYVWLYLVQQSPALQQRMLPVYINVDWYKHELHDDKAEGELSAKIGEITREALLKNVIPFSDVTNEALWAYLKQTREFSFLTKEERDLCTTFADCDERVLSVRVREARSRAASHREFPFMVARYVASCLGKSIVLIYDNVDPLSLKVHRVGLYEANTFAEKYGLCTIVSMRRRTFDELAEDHGGLLDTLPHIHVSMEGRDVAEYLDRRLAAALEKTKSARFEYTDRKGRLITHENAREVLTLMCKALLNQACTQALSEISYRNLRKLGILVRKYFASGYVDMHDLVWAIVGQRVGANVRYDSALWVLLSSVITCNHKTYFSKRHPDPRVRDCMMNVYCNNSLGVNDRTIRIHLLRHLRRQTVCSFASVRDTYAKLYTEAPANLERALCRALRRFLQCNLLISPQYYKVTNDQDATRLEAIELTSTGEYYLDELSQYFEYLMYMKDDVMLDGTEGLRSCIDLDHRQERYEEVCKFLTLVFAEEDVFLRSLNAAQRSQMREAFSADSDANPYVSHAPVTAMITFGEKREMSPGSIEGYRRLLATIEDSHKAFRMQCTADGTA